MSRSLISWSPTLASVPLLKPKPSVPPLPKFEMPPAANPAMIRMTTSAITQVPILDLEARRKKESIGFQELLEGDRRFRGRAGAHQAAPLRRFDTAWGEGEICRSGNSSRAI